MTSVLSSTWKSILSKRTGRWLGALTTLLSSGTAYGHAFGQRYDLPIPLNLYLWGSAAAVFFSFVLVAVFLRSPAAGHIHYPRFNLLSLPWMRWLTDDRLVGAFRFAGVAIYLLMVTTGLIGIQDPQQNLLPTMVWIIWWTGMAYVCALIGDLWALINPLNTLFFWAERLWSRLGSPPRDLSLNLPYPARLGVWPACVLFWLFVWGELIWPANAIPSNLAFALIGYSLITWSGMFLFGRNTWLRHGEAFTLVFSLLSRFAVLELRVKAPPSDDAHPDRQLKDGVNCYPLFTEAPAHQRELNLRPFGAGLLVGQTATPSMMCFVILMLSTVTFDGFMGTPLWADILEAIPDWRGLQPFLFNMELNGISREVVITTAGLAFFPVLFVGIYLFVTWLMKQSVMRLSEQSRTLSTLETGRIFVYSLLPIALAYHLAHYFSFLLTVGQLVIPLASDPFGVGWDLLNTADYRINIALVGARFIWLTSVITVVLGHIIAVYVAHALALRALDDRKAGLVSQIPMVALMVSYTVLSLWILAQPLIQ